MHGEWLLNGFGSGYVHVAGDAFSPKAIEVYSSDYTPGQVPSRPLDNSAFCGIV
jgi:hypothetical protein